MRCNRAATMARSIGPRTRLTRAVALGLSALAAASLQAPAGAQTIRTGTGFAVSPATHVVTNAHVAGGCRSLRVLQGNASAPASLLVTDEALDLAVLRTELHTARVAALRSTPALRVGENVVSFGFPLSGALSKEGNLTTGNVSALAGLRDDSTYLQMTAPVQPGNSGGPLLDSSAHVVGVVTAKLDAVAIARRTGDIPQNVNFAIKAEVLRALLRANGVPFDEEASDRTLAVADIAELARGFTVQIECVPGRGGPAQSGNVEVTPRPMPSPPPEPPAAAPNAPAPVIADAGREQQVEQVHLIGVRTPYPGTAPETRELTIANRADKSIYKVTIAWLEQPLQRCPAAPSAYSGQRELYVGIQAGGQGRTMGDFPANARLFCIVDAAFVPAGRPRESSVIPDQPPPPAPVPPVPEETAPAPEAPTAPAQPKPSPRTGSGRQ